MEKVVVYRSKYGALFETEEACRAAEERHEAMYKLVDESFAHLEYYYDTDRISEGDVTQFVMENYETIKAIMEAK